MSLPRRQFCCQSPAADPGNMTQFAQLRPYLLKVSILLVPRTDMFGEDNSADLRMIKMIKISKVVLTFIKP